MQSLPAMATNVVIGIILVVRHLSAKQLGLNYLGRD